MQMGEKDDIFGRFDRGHTVFLSLHSHRESYQASKCGISALFLMSSDGFLKLSVTANLRCLIKFGMLDRITA